MNGGFEPVLHALSVEPRSARPGETVRLIFRTPNLGTSASPAATIRFLLVPGLEPLGETSVACDPVAPGEAVVATVDARVSPSSDEREPLAAQALLAFGETVLATNVCRVTVLSRPILDGPSSGVWVEASGDDHVRVRAVVANEGDGSARGLRIRLPAPPGTERIGAINDAAEIARLEPGACATIAFEARIVAAAGRYAVEDAIASHDDGCVALPSRAHVDPQPALAPPRVTLVAGRRHAEITAELRNDGWADARDVPLRFGLPATSRLVDGSIVVDGIPLAARARRGVRANAVARMTAAREQLALVVRRVPARETLRVAFALVFPEGFEGGTLQVAAAGHELAVACVPERVRELRLRLIETPHAIARGATATLVAELTNAGDRAERVLSSVSGADVVESEGAPAVLASGEVATLRFVVRAPDELAEGVVLPLAVVASDERAILARAECELLLRAAPNLAPPTPVPVPPAKRAPEIAGTLSAPCSAIAGATVEAALEMRVDGEVETLRLRITATAAAYVAGSTRLDGRALLDVAAGSPFAGDGLVLRNIPAGTSLRIAWALRVAGAPSDGVARIDAVAIADAVVVALDPVTIAVRERDPFARRPAGFAYDVDARALDDDVPVLAPLEAAPSPLPCEIEEVFDDDDVLVGVRFDRLRREGIARLVRDGGGALVAHVVALRALFPEVAGDDPALAAAFGDVREALRDVFDRLFVKLRIPGFEADAVDLEDGRLRCALRALFAALLLARREASAQGQATLRLSRARIRTLQASLEEAPLGTPAMLRALAALLAVESVDGSRLSEVLRDYAAALDAALAGCEDAPERFADALGADAGKALAQAREALVDALDAAPPRDEAA